MAAHVCPWWLAYTFDNFLRRLAQPAEKVVGPYVAPGQTVLDLGCGMGYFSLAMARMVGPAGRVMAVDLQEKMLAVTMRRAKKAGLAERIRPLKAAPDRLGLTDLADFALACWVLHEVPDQLGFLTQVREALKETGRFLILEPKFHVTPAEFEASLDLLPLAGLKPLGRPPAALSRSILVGPVEYAAAAAVAGA